MTTDSNTGKDPGPVSSAKLVSVILSFRNEEAVIPELVSRLTAVFEDAAEDFELVFVNDCSSDGSLKVLQDLRADEPRIKILNMARRSGVFECILAGLEAARGDAFVYMDCDLQDPPEVIPELLEKWRDGAKMVYTVRTERDGENPLKMWVTRQAYRVINAISEVEMPVNAGDFRLIDRVIRDHLLALPEQDPYLRGLVTWVGYRQEPVYYRRAGRAAGEGHFPLLRSLNPYRVFIAGLTSFSAAPVYITLMAGVGGVALSLLSFLCALILGSSTFGWVGFGLILWATLMVALGFVGIYVTRTFKETKQRPRYIVAERIGFDD
ncbi:MAG: glycosyltransferase family 2 protein [Magnetovibrionaceae bacterium]